MKKYMLILGVVGLVLVGGCANKKEDAATKTTASSFSTTEKSSSETKQTTQSSQTEAKPNADQLFAELPQADKIVLYANLVDHRVEEYPGLEGFTLLYQEVGNEVFLQLTSGAGSGHPIYHLVVGENIVKPIQGVSYMGAGAEQPYKEVGVSGEEVTKEALYQTYLSNQDNIESASQKVQQDDHLQEAFNNAVSAIGQ